MTEELHKAVVSLSEKYDVDPLILRIKISKPNRDLEYHVMRNSEIIDETNIATVLNIMPLKAFVVGVKLNSIFNKLAESNQIEKSRMNVRIYIKSVEDTSPHIYLFDDTKAVRKVALEEIN